MILAKRRQSSEKSHKPVKDAGKPRHPATGLFAPPMLPPASDIPVKTADSEDAVDTGIPAVDPKKQSWYRLPTSKTRKLAEKIAVMDAIGRKDADIAKRLKTTAANVSFTRYVARKNGWWDVNDEPIDVEVELALNIDHKVVRNLSASLDGKMTNWQTHETTLAAAKGRGMFKSYEQTKAEGASVMGMIGLQIIMPTLGAEDQRIEMPDSMIGGVPSYVDGEEAVVSGHSRLDGPSGAKALPERTPSG